MLNLNQCVAFYFTCFINKNTTNDQKKPSPTGVKTHTLKWYFFHNIFLSILKVCEYVHNCTFNIDCITLHDFLSLIPTGRIQVRVTESFFTKDKTSNKTLIWVSYKMGVYNACMINKLCHHYQKTQLVHCKIWYHITTY